MNRQACPATFKLSAFGNATPSALFIHAGHTTAQQWRNSPLFAGESKHSGEGASGRGVGLVIARSATFTFPFKGKVGVGMGITAC